MGWLQFIQCTLNHLVLLLRVCLRLRVLSRTVITPNKLIAELQGGITIELFHPRPYTWVVDEDSYPILENRYPCAN